MHNEQGTACSNGLGVGSPLVSNDRVYGILAMPRSKCGAAAVTDIFTSMRAQRDWIWLITDGL